MSVFICSQPESVCSTDLFVFDLIVSGEPEKQPASLGNLPGLLWALRGVGLGHFSQLKLLRMCPFPTGEPGPRGNYRPRWQPRVGSGLWTVVREASCTGSLFSYNFNN